MRAFKPEFASIDPVTVLTVTSVGDPNQSGKYLEALYGTAYQTKFKVFKPRRVARSRLASPAPGIANGAARSAATRNKFARISEWYRRGSGFFRLEYAPFAVLAYAVPRKVTAVHRDIHSRR